MLDQLHADLKLDLSNAVMVGDRLNTDIAFGNSRAGHTLLVMTGVTQLADVRCPFAVLCADHNVLLTT